MRRDWTAASLAAIAAVAASLRQVFGFRENWIMRAVALEASNADIARCLAGDGSPEQRALIERVAATGIAETARRKDLLDQRGAQGEPTTDRKATARDGESSAHHERPDPMTQTSMRDEQRDHANAHE